jgi:hypothetical protein
MESQMRDAARRNDLQELQPEYTRKAMRTAYDKADISTAGLSVKTEWNKPES